MEQAEYIWKDGEFVKWEDATTHVLVHGLHYGTSFFEGIRLYDTHNGPAIFRLTDHIQRLIDSAKIYGIDMPYSVDEMSEICRETIRKNGLKSAYIRPISYLGYGSLKVAPEDLPIETVVAAFPWGAYLGEEGLENGIDVCISSWNRVAPNTVPTSAKVGGNYISGFLISNEAHRRGFAEGIALTPNGTLSEGAGENLFVIKNGKLFTPHTASSILSGITRDTIIQLAKGLSFEVVEQTLSREFLYLADEIFFTGTAAEITPIRSVDERQIGAGKRGPITKKIQERFFGLFSGDTEDPNNWLDFV